MPGSHHIFAALSANFTFVQSVNSPGFANTSSKAATLGSAPSSGDLVVVCVGHNSGQVVSGVASTSATWIQAATSNTVLNNGADIWYSTTVTTTTITVTLSGTAYGGFEVLHFTGNAASPADGSMVAASSASTAPAPGSLTPSSANELVVAMMEVGSTTVSASPAGYTVGSVINDSSVVSVQAGYLQESAASATNPTWTTGSAGWGAASVAFKPLGSFDPTTVAGCQLYLRSDLGVTLSDSVVTAWADQSGNGRNATSVNNPTQVANVQNGYPSIRFASGSSQYFTLASSAMGGQNWSMFAVFKLTTTTANQVIYSEANTSTQYRFAWTNTQLNVDVYDGGTLLRATDATTLAAGTCYVATGTSANGNPAIAYINGDAGTSAAHTEGAWTASTFTIGARKSSGGINLYANQDLMALIVYNNVLSSTDRAYVRDGLKNLYAVY